MAFSLTVLLLRDVCKWKERLRASGEKQPDRQDSIL
jgi:hypothetical protein